MNTNHLQCVRCKTAFPCQTDSPGASITVLTLGRHPHDPFQTLDPCPICKVRAEAIPVKLVTDVTPDQKDFVNAKIDELLERIEQEQSKRVSVGAAPSVTPSVKQEMVDDLNSRLNQPHD